VIDGDAVKALTDDDILGQIKSANDAGAEIVAANDALSINGIDSDSLPDYIDTGNPGIIAVVDAQTKGFQYYKL
jgi:intracellular sulfur oxidation DsrE/DsrF family protein